MGDSSLEAQVELTDKKCPIENLRHHDTVPRDFSHENEPDDISADSSLTQKTTNLNRPLDRFHRIQSRYDPRRSRSRPTRSQAQQKRSHRAMYHHRLPTNGRRRYRRIHRNPTRTPSLQNRLG